jgi:GT2 family glycosyltransferase
VDPASTRTHQTPLASPTRPTGSWWVCLLNWNGREDTLRCLDSLSRVAGAAGVVVVDNGSHDGSVPAIRAAFPDVELLETGANLGYAGGNNAGIRHALERGADWVVLINNDATAAPDAIDAFAAAAARHPGAGILAGKVYFAGTGDRIWWAGQRVGLRSGYSGRPRGYGRSDGPEFEREQPTERAVGALMAVSRAAIDAVGLLDEALFAYVEDVDWSLRMRRAGFEVIFVPAAHAWHAVGGSTGGEYGSTHTLYYGVRNTIVVCERHRPLGRIGTAARRCLVLASYLALVPPRRPWRRSLAAVLEGFAAARAGRLGPRPVSGE